MEETGKLWVYVPLAGTLPATVPYQGVKAGSVPASSVNMHLRVRAVQKLLNAESMRSVFYRAACHSFDAAFL